MKNWKTTLAGLIASLPIAFDALYTAYTAGAFTDKTGGQLLVAIGIALFARYAKDHNVSGAKKEVQADDIVGDRPKDRG